MIRKATKEDEGVYICKANSNLGEAKTRAKLYVKSNNNKIIIILLGIQLINYIQNMEMNIRLRKKN